MPPLTALCDAIIFTGEAWVENHAVLVRNGQIVDIVANRRIPTEATRLSYANQILTTGFIDAQVNGGGNILLNNAPTTESCLAIAAAHRQYGTTHLLPTLMTDSFAAAQQAIAATRAARRIDRGILGIHLEGPHIAVEARGIHNKDHIRPLNNDTLALYRREEDEVFLITLAPENVTPAIIHVLREQGIVVSLGHTKALPDQIKASLHAGATGFTHLFNGMGGLSARAPGSAGIALDNRDSWCSLIADGHHVSPEMIRIACYAKPQGKVFLVSDAMAPAATDTPQPFDLYGERIRVENGQCLNADNKLAGSAITLLDAVRHCVTVVGLELDETLRMASAYPAAFLGVGDRLGKVLPGYDASLIALRPDLAAAQAIFAPTKPPNPPPVQP